MIHDPLKDALLDVPLQWREEVFTAAKEMVRQHRNGGKMNNSIFFQAAVVRVAWAILEEERRDLWS